MATVIARRRSGSKLHQQRNVSEVIADVLALTREAEQLQLHRVVLCLQYAYWEALCEVSPKSALN